MGTTYVGMQIVRTDRRRRILLFMRFVTSSVERAFEYSDEEVPRRVSEYINNVYVCDFQNQFYAIYTRIVYYTIRGVRV